MGYMEIFSIFLPAPNILTKFVSLNRARRETIRLYSSEDRFVT